MKNPERLTSVFLPPPELSELDTGLRFTDILFGFVISQIFLRLQHFGELPGFVRWQLVVSAALVLGSWIGFRRSLNRSSYELKFFNLPLARFIVDQLMILFYFRITVLTPNDPEASFDPSSLVSDTFQTLVIIFGLYLLWDLLGQLMSIKWKSKKKYEGSDGNVPGVLITFAFGLAFVALLHIAAVKDVDEALAVTLFAVATALLLGYRWAKEIRTTWKQLQKAQPRKVKTKQS